MLDEANEEGLGDCYSTSEDLETAGGVFADRAMRWSGVLVSDSGRVYPNAETGVGIKAAHQLRGGV